MKKILKRALFLLLAVISVVGLVVTYLYLNPTIDDPDFHLEYEIANGKKKYAEDRKADYPIGIIDYLENNKYRLFMVEYKNDSIFVLRKPFLQEPDAALFSKGNELKAEYQTHHLRNQINNYEKHKNTFRNSGGIFSIIWDLQVINFCHF